MKRMAMSRRMILYRVFSTTTATRTSPLSPTETRTIITTATSRSSTIASSTATTYAYKTPTPIQTYSDRFLPISRAPTDSSYLCYCYSHLQVIKNPWLMENLCYCYSYNQGIKNPWLVEKSLHHQVIQNSWLIEKSLVGSLKDPTAAILQSANLFLSKQIWPLIVLICYCP